MLAVVGHQHDEHDGGSALSNKERNREAKTERVCSGLFLTQFTCYGVRRHITNGYHSDSVHHCWNGILRSYYG